MEYGSIKETDLNFESALAKVDTELQKEGFKILTEIDVQTKFEEKLNIDFPKYMILGACNPMMAHKAITTEWDIGLLLPCNVIVYEKESKVRIGVMRPTAAMAAVRNEALRGLAGEVEAKLRKVFDNI